MEENKDGGAAVRGEAVAVSLKMSADEAQQLANLVFLVDGTGPHCATAFIIGCRLRDMGFNGKIHSEVAGRIFCRSARAADALDTKSKTEK